MDYDEAWEIFKGLEGDDFLNMKRAGRNSFSIDRLNGNYPEDQGIGSSDVNHRAVDLIRAAGRMLNEEELKEIDDELERLRDNVGWVI